MLAFLTFIFSILYHVHESGGTSCDTIEYTFINDSRRSTAIESSSPYICDRGFIEDDKWYRFHSEAGDTMPTENPGILHCGTYVPIWLNGDHPEEDNVLRNVTACAAIPFLFPPGCGVSYPIQVIKCPGDFYLYKLKEPRQCSLAYCAGKNIDKEWVLSYIYYTDGLNLLLFRLGSKKPVGCSATGERLPVCSGKFIKSVIHIYLD